MLQRGETQACSVREENLPTLRERIRDDETDDADLLQSGMQSSDKQCEISFKEKTA